MFLQAHPERVRSDEEKEEIAQKYKPGDAVLPEDESDGEGEGDEEDRRLLEEVRERSLRELDLDLDAGRDRNRDRNRRSSPRTGHSSRSRHRDAGERTTDDERHRRRREEERMARRQAQQHAARSAARAGSVTRTASGPSRQIEHQSSLRSLLSTSEGESIEEEILRQIVEEGLLDGINLDDLDPAQEEELSERIAEAYRRKHRHRWLRRNDSVEGPRESVHRRARSHTIEGRGTVARESSRHPPVSRPHLLEQTSTLFPPISSAHRRRASDLGAARRRTSPAPVNQGATSEVVLRSAVETSSDVTAERPPSAHAGRTRIRGSSASTSRRATEPEGRISEREHQTGIPTVSSPTSITPSVRPAASHHSTPSYLDHATSGLISSLPAENGTTDASAEAPDAPTTLYPEPSISCNRCNRPDIQYDLYKNCPRCNDGNFNLCLRCYRFGRGCLHWFGFGPSAQFKFAQNISNIHPALREPPHVLRSYKYRKPAETAHRAVNDEGRQTTSDNPAERLEDGVFCDICQTLANDCYWKCNQCNDGEWGFCNRCVNQGRCCTHPLLPVRRVSPSNNNNNAAGPPTAADASNTTTTTTTTTTSLTAPPLSIDSNETYHVLSFSTKCDICTYPITPSSSRFHCPHCNDGDYDICTNCYLKLVAAGKISKENGHNGWRRCLKGHRMIVVGFEDHEDGGQRRVVVRDLVGGHALKDEHVAVRKSPRRSDSSCSSAAGSPTGSPVELGSGYWTWKDGYGPGQEGRKKASRVRNNTQWTWTLTGSGGINRSDTPSSPTSSSPATNPTATRRFPPDGGVGLVVQALWSYYPDEDVNDELLFPRGAEITEAENVNDDWFWGCYAGVTGLFPGGHGRVVREVL